VNSFFVIGNFGFYFYNKYYTVNKTTFNVVQSSLD